MADRRLVKTRRFKDPVYVGDPLNVVKIFNDKGADELIILDIHRSRVGGRPDFDYIEQVASECFMPVCYGGGVKSISDARKVFRAGVEKIAVNSGALEDPNLVSSLCEEFGAQSVVLSLDLQRNRRGHLQVFDSSRRRTLKMDAVSYLTEMETRGIGELLTNFVNHDGMCDGLDLEALRIVLESSEVPVIAMGGVGRIEHVKDALAAGASAVAAGSIFVFSGPHKAVLITYPDPSIVSEL